MNEDKIRSLAVIGSNTIYTMCAVLLMIKGYRKYTLFIWSWEISTLLNVAFASSMYHWCDDTLLNHCIAPYSFLITYDDITSFLTFSAAFTIHLPHPDSGYKLVPTIITPIMVCLVSTLATIITLVLWNIFAIIVSKTHTRWYNTDRKEKRKNIVLLLLCLISLAGAYYCKKIGSEISDKFTLYHTLWHVFTGLSFMFSIFAVVV